MMSLPDLREGAMLLVDKPSGWTSFDVVNKIRFAAKKKYQVKKIKVGHAGTLDPLATGLLIICTGKMTKKIDAYQGMDKVYTGSLRLGATTPTYDAESEVDATYPTDKLGPEQILEAAKNLEGTIEQTPPVYSAIKIGGKRAYDLARKNRPVEMRKRTVQIHYFKVTDLRIPDLSFKIKCSKGTYIRSLAYDLGRLVDNGAYLTSLRRTQIGEYDVEDAWSLDDLIETIHDQKL